MSIKYLFVYLIIPIWLLVAFPASSQLKSPLEDILSRLSFEERVPEDLLAKKAVLLFDPTTKGEQLDQIQESFQRTGIDVVLHFPIDIPKSNEDVNKVFVNYLIGRDIRFLIFLRQISGQSEFLFTTFNRKTDWVDSGQLAWRVTGFGISNLLESIYRVSVSSQKKKNLLIIERPEKELNLDPVTGNRNEFFATDLQVDRLAIIQSGQKDFDEPLESYFKENYPYKYKVFEPGSDERRIRGDGFLYVLKWIYCRSSASMDLLGYDLSNVGHRVKSVSYTNGKAEDISIPAEEPAFKFYFKHLENGNVYLGKGWDGSLDWREALNNHILGLRSALSLK